MNSSVIKVSNLDFESKSQKPIYNGNIFDYSNTDIQTVADDVLEKIFRERNFKYDDIPKKSEIIEFSQQSDYYKSIKKDLEIQLKEKKFAIIDGPTGTGKTTLAKTYSYESSIPVFELGGDSEKTIEDFTKEIKTYRKNNIFQIKSIPGILEKAISCGGIILINEANSLSSDIQLALANISEGGFITVGTKKIKISPNFRLIFTSNNGYAGTQEYNAAVIRKAGGLINLNYEPDVEGESKIVTNISKKIQSKFEENIQLDDENIRKITEIVRKIREAITKHNEESDSDNTLKTEDFNNFGDFLYTRFYDQLLTNILYLNKNQVNLKEQVKKILFSLLEENIYGLVGFDYISHNNDVQILENIINDIFEQEDEYVNIVSDGREKLDPDLLKICQIHLQNKDLLKNFVCSDSSDDEQEGDTPLNALPRFNSNLFRQTIQNEVVSKGEELERLENFYDFIENVYSLIIESRRKKIITQINRDKLKNNQDVLIVSINGRDIYFVAKNNDFDFSQVNNEEDVKNYIFGNNDLSILIPRNQDETIELSQMNSFEFINYDNIFLTFKNLEITRFSKVIHREVNDKKIISLLGFTGEVRDVRYKSKETGKFYIPNSKVNNILLNNYEIIDENDDFFTNKTDGQHILTLNSYQKVESLTKKKVLERLNNGVELTLLKQIKDVEFNESLDTEIKDGFSQIDKLNLHNGGKEKVQTATPESIYPNKTSISSRVFDILAPNFGGIISQSTKEVLDEMEKQANIGNDILLRGPSGVGKTSYVQELANMLELPYVSFQIDSNVKEATFISDPSFEEGELENKITPILDYYINGGVIELKELNMAVESTFLNNFLDKDGSVTINGNQYKRNPKCIIVGTINNFDNRLFPGNNPMNTASQSRFVNIDVDYIQNVEEEAKLLLGYAKIGNQDLVETIGEDNLFTNIKEILRGLVHYGRNEVKELKNTQDAGTSEKLKEKNSKIITVDIFKKMLLNSSNIEELEITIDNFVN